MIVKNESKIIRRLLDSVFLYIDSYCICDTGSTDDTIAIIEQFAVEKGITGRIVHQNFRDFGFNRTFALRACNDITVGADYLLLLDADMQFTCKLTPQAFRSRLTQDAYYIYQGSSDYFYKNVRLVKNRQGFSYWGVTHEYIDAPQGTIYDFLERHEAFINDIGDGGSKGNKCERDIQLLERGLEQCPNNDRYTFYLANSYSDKGDNENAIIYYQKRIALGGWIEEIWHSHYSMARCYQRMNNMPLAIFHWMEAYQVFPERIENLYEIVQYYRLQGNNVLSYMFYCVADTVRKKQTKTDYLFFQKCVYDYKLDYELTIIGYYSNPDGVPLNEVCMKVICAQGLDDVYYHNVLSNYKFYAQAIVKYGQRAEGLQQLTSPPEKFGTIRNIVPKPNTATMDDAMITSTPTMVRLTDGSVLVAIRYVNYRIDHRGNYINQNNIVSKTIFFHDHTSSQGRPPEGLLEYNTAFDGYYVGPEDVRLLCIQGRLYYNANRSLPSGQMCVEHGEIDMSKAIPTCIHSRILKMPTQRSTEKNWVLFPTSDGKVGCVYQWSPLTIGQIDEESTLLRVTLVDLDVPMFFKDLRGSTNGVLIGNELWFICHLVSYEERRYYYHIMVVLDAHTLKLKQHSPLWTFEKEKVEYTLGFVEKDQNTLLIGYSVMDCETKFIEVPKNVFFTHNIAM